MRQVWLTLLKLSIVGGALGWLVETGKLNFGELSIFVREPTVLVANVALWVICYAGLGTLRWYLLLRGVGLRVTLRRTVRLQLIGFFFNTAIPGAVGGDIVKAIYVVRDQDTGGKTAALLTVLLDRVVGLAGLFLIAGIAVLSYGNFLGDFPALTAVMGAVLAGVLGLILLTVLVFLPMPASGDPIVRLLSRPWPGFGLLSKIYQALRSYRTKPLVLAGALGLSVVIQLATLGYAYYVMKAVVGSTLPFAAFSALYAVGSLASALPVMPGGLGIGHVAFDKLFAMAGIAGGANIFNVVALGQLALNLLGFIPYVLNRSEMPVDAARLKGALQNAG